VVNAEARKRDRRRWDGLAELIRHEEKRGAVARVLNAARPVSI
jgi:hypothetical protein